MTVGELLHEAAGGLDRSGSDTPRLDAEVLLGHVLGVDRATLLAAPEALVGEGAAETFRTLVERRATGEPVAYIRGSRSSTASPSQSTRGHLSRGRRRSCWSIWRSRASGTALTAGPRPPGTPPLE